MPGDGADLLAVAEASYWPLRCLAGPPAGTPEDAGELVGRMWAEGGDQAGPAGPSLEGAVGALLRHLVAAEAGAEAAGPAVPAGWFLPTSDRWAGWWDREPAPFAGLDLDGEPARTAATDALGQLPVTARAVVVLADVATMAPAAARALLGLDGATHLALLHAGRSHVRRALEALADDREPVAGQPAVAEAAAPAPSREKDISCDRLTGLTTEYLEGAIPARLRTTFEQHLVVCPPCVEHLGQLRATVQALHGLGRRPVPDPARARLAAALAGG